MIGSLILQFYTCQIQQADFIYILTPVKFATGSVLHQMQNGKPKLIAYAS